MATGGGGGGRVAPGMAAWLYESAWDERLWLPKNLTWKDLEEKPELNLMPPQCHQLLSALPLALAFITLRYVFDRTIALPLGRALGVKEKVKRLAIPNAELERVYQVRKQPNQGELEGLAKRSDWSLRRVERWFRQRRNQDRSNVTKKFCEASWRFTFYIIAFCTGLWVLVDKPWFWNLKSCWTNYPTQSVLVSQYWYYMLELGFYLSLLFSVAFDVKRKDFKEQLIHHFATITLISFSYVVNLIRAGTLIMLVHDVADFFLESAKMFLYADWKRSSHVLFMIFTPIFLISRLVIFPFWIIHCTAILSLESYEPFFGYYFFNGMLLLLQSLHIFWAFLILRMLHHFVFVGPLEKDERSDADESEGPEDEGNHEPDVRIPGSMAFDSTLSNGHFGHVQHRGSTPTANGCQSPKIPDVLH
uniref:ceramide synthase 2 n=1 Tax=Myxine glutinosa TaxID=7769 RepID=UPI00358FB63C